MTFWSLSTDSNFFNILSTISFFSSFEIVSSNETSWRSILSSLYLILYKAFNSSVNLRLLLDITSSKIITDYKIVLNELFKYNKELLKKPRITVLNKVDLVDENTLNKKIKSLVEYEKKLHTISALNVAGLDHVIKDAYKKISKKIFDDEKQHKIEKKWNPID